MNLSFPVHQSPLAYIGCAALCSAWHHTANAQPMPMLLPKRRDMHNACAVTSGKNLDCWQLRKRQGLWTGSRSQGLTAQSPEHGVLQCLQRC